MNNDLPICEILLQALTEQYEKTGTDFRTGCYSSIGRQSVQLAYIGIPACKNVSAYAVRDLMTALMVFPSALPLRSAMTVFMIFPMSFDATRSAYFSLT